MIGDEDWRIKPYTEGLPPKNGCQMAWCDAPTAGGRFGIIRCSGPKVLDYTAHGKSLVEKRTRIVHERRFEREEISPHHKDDTKEKYEASTHEQGNCMDFDAGIMSTSQRYAPRLSGE